MGVRRGFSGPGSFSSSELLRVLCSQLDEQTRRHADTWTHMPHEVETRGRRGDCLHCVCALTESVAFCKRAQSDTL